MIRITLILFMILCVSPSFAQIYKWVDEQGGVHYADDLTSVPEKYHRSMMKVEGVDLGGGKGSNENPPRNREDNYKDRLGRGEDYWRGQVAGSKDRMRSLQEKGEDLKLKYNELSTRFNESRSSVERAGLRNERDQIKQEMDKNKAQIEEVRITIEKKIPEEAEFYKAKPEWVK